ncbi:MAG: hypothetical protein AB1752_04510 [Candidatus Zixiibacteriota bacterium]
MTNNSPDSDFIRRLAAVVRAWCRDEPLRHADECWMVERMVDMVLQDRTCSIRLRAAGSAQGVTDVRAIAIDYMGETLARNPRNTLADLLGAVVDERAAVLVSALRRQLVVTTRSNLFHRWKESDPIGASIYESLWDELGNHPERYVLVPNDRAAARLVTAANDGNLRTDNGMITREEMVRLIGESWKGSRFIPPCIRDVLSIIQKDDQWSALVPITEVLFEGLCDAARMGIMRHEELRFNPSPMTPEVRMAFDASLSAMLPSVQRVTETYTRNGRLSPDLAKGMIGAVRAIFEDFGLTGDRDVPYKDYVLRSCPELCEAEYEARVKPKFQYLMRLASDALEREFKKRWGE